MDALEGCYQVVLACQRRVAGVPRLKLHAVSNPIAPGILAGAFNGRRIQVRAIHMNLGVTLRHADA